MSTNLITVTPTGNRKLYFRQYHYLRLHPDCKEMPKHLLSNPACETNPTYKYRTVNQAGSGRYPQMTVTSKENPKLYQRQINYLKKNPECKELPEKYLSLDTAITRANKGKCKDERMTVSNFENVKLYARQKDYIRTRPECKEIPEWLKKGEPMPKNEKRSRLECPSGRAGKKHTDTRITVRNIDNKIEYQRQYQYIKRHPECTEVPPA